MSALRRSSDRRLWFSAMFACFLLWHVSRLSRFDRSCVFRWVYSLLFDKARSALSLVNLIFWGQQFAASWTVPGAVACVGRAFGVATHAVVVNMHCVLVALHALVKLSFALVLFIFFFCRHVLLVDISDILHFLEGLFARSLVRWTLDTAVVQGWTQQVVAVRTKFSLRNIGLYISCFVRLMLPSHRRSLHSWL